MTIKLIAGFETITEDPQANPRVISPWDRVSGDFGVLVAGLRGSFKAFEFTDTAWWQTKENFMPANGTDYWWFHEDFNLTSIERKAQWQFWRIGNFPICYGIGVSVSDTDAENREIVLFRGDYTDSFNPTFTKLRDSRIGDGPLFHISARFKRVTPFPVEVWIDGVKEIDYAGDATISDPNPTRIDYHHIEFIAGKFGGDIVVAHDNFIYSDEEGDAPFNGRLDAGWNVMGHQPDGDGTPADWTPNPIGSKTYYVLADLNRASDPNPGADDSAGGGVGDDHRVTIVDKNAAGVAKFVTIYVSSSTSVDGKPATMFLPASSDPFTWKTIRTFGTQDAAAYIPGPSWDNTKFNGMEIRLEGAYGLRQLCVELLGQNLAQPAQTPAPVAAAFPHSQAVII